MDAPTETRRQGGIHTRRILLGLLFMLAGTFLFPAFGAMAQDGQETVSVVRIDGTIDLGLVPYLARVLEQADQENAQAVILEINTPGGRLDAALQMRDTLLNTPVRTIAYVNREAFSAGALIAIAAEEIYLAPGAVMGAATPVTGTGETADEKVVSAVRTTFRSTAELRGRNPQVAEAMVDPRVSIDGLVSEGQLLTLTTTEALAWEYADGVAENRQQLLDATGLAGVSVEETSAALAEQVVRFLTHPIVASLLTALGFLLIVVDVSSGGLGILSVIGVSLFAIFFWGHFLAGLAGWEGVALLVVGLALIGVEVFVIPGFGVAGVLGVAAILGSLYLSVTGGQIVTPQDTERGVMTMGLTLLLILLGGALAFWLLPKAGPFRGLVLQTQLGHPDLKPAATGPIRLEPLQPKEVARQATSDQFGNEEPKSLLGAHGRALSDLRPGGFALIAGDRVDVVSRGDYIRAGEEVEVILDECYRRVVRRVEPEDGEVRKHGSS